MISSQFEFRNNCNICSFFSAANTYLQNLIFKSFTSLVLKISHKCLSFSCMRDVIYMCSPDFTTTYNAIALVYCMIKKM